MIEVVKALRNYRKLAISDVEMYEQRIQDHKESIRKAKDWIEQLEEALLTLGVSVEEEENR